MTAGTPARIAKHVTLRMPKTKLYVDSPDIWGRAAAGIGGGVDPFMGLDNFVSQA
jgi:hypothetical protein